MIHRMGRKKYQIYAFDIESHNDVESIIKNETSMWLGTIIDEDSKASDETSYIYNMDDFIKFCEDKTSGKRKNANQTRPCRNLCVYIYNLSFEYSFILPRIINYGLNFKAKIEDDDEFVFNSVTTKTCSSVWMVQMKFGKKSGIVVLKDLAKIFGGGLGKVAKSFNLPTQKGEIDYRLNRLRPKEQAERFEKYVLDHPEVYDRKGVETWKEICEAVNIPLEQNYTYTPTQEEKIYCFKDTRIIIDILKIMDAKGDKEFFNVSSMASYAMKVLLHTGWPRNYKPYQEYRKLYPELSFEENDFLRKGVEGGITYATPRYQYKNITQPILHIDAHQMHPTQAYMHSFPYGFGEYGEGEPTDYFSYIHCCRIRISYSGVKLHSIIKLIGIDLVEDAEITVWDFEIPTMYKIYENLEITYIDYYKYKKKVLPWRRFYANNYYKRLEAKKNKDDFNILYYKLLNNSSYGKHLEKPHNEIFANCINFEDIIDSNIIEKDEKEANAKYTYLPIGSCIPAYSRVNLVETALKFGWEKIIYFDTDSIFCIYDEDTKRVWEQEIDHKDFLGGWGLEEISEEGCFAAPKRYKLNVDGKLVVRAGGINFDEFKKAKALLAKEKLETYQVPYDEINIISSRWKVQRAYRVKGGTIIDFQMKEMKIPEKYLAIYKKNVLQ